MPLVRYEIRNEHSLANPQLYRTAAKDDPEGLLEGVAMAGLVGIVRQLGDLAEFAAEVFRDLHEEVMATASRGHELLARVQQLEAEMPAVEKALLSETNQLRFAYTPGVEWHASIRNDQNHCTQGDLPRFIRSSYEECRGPPRLFLLDKFDVAGAGACLKRYTDPSFFRTEWASSELMKAERIQRDKRARREKKKGRRRRNADGKDSIVAEQYSTFSQELSRELSQRNQAHSRHPAADSQGPRQQLVTRTNDSPLGSARETGDTFIEIPAPVPTVAEVLRSSPPKYQKSVSAMSVDETMLRAWEESAQADDYPEEVPLPVHEEEPAAPAVDDGGSEGEQFLDALTTMESEADSDSEKNLRQDRDLEADNLRDTTEQQATTDEEGFRVHGGQTSADEEITQSENQSLKTMSPDHPVQETPLEPKVITDGQDGSGLSCSTSVMHLRRRSSDSIASSTTAVHARRQSSDSIASSTTAMHTRRRSSDSTSSQSFTKAKRVQVLEEPHKSVRPSSEPLKDEKAVTDPVDQGSFMSFNSGVKVSKMVAAFEAGSFEQVKVEGLEKEHAGITTVSHPVGSVSDALSQATVEPDGRAGVPEYHSNSPEDSGSQFAASSAETDSISSKEAFPKFHGSLPGSMKGKSSSISSHTSLGSLDSPPDSPTFSALQSPVSPRRSERNILLSPDSHGLTFPVEILSPGSPTSVPILAFSPTSQQRRHLIIEPFSLASPSSSPVEFPSSPQSKQYSERDSPSQTIDNIADDSATTVLPSTEDSSYIQSALPARSLDEESGPSSPPVLPPELVSPVQSSSDDLEEQHDLPLPADELVQSSADEVEPKTSPRTHGVEYSDDPISPTQESIDEEISMSSTHVNNNVPHHESTEVEERIEQEPIPVLPLPSVSKSNQEASSQSAQLHEFAPRTLPPVKHDKLSLPSSSRRRSFETTSQFSSSEAAHDYLFIPNATHRRFPSLPVVGKTVLDFSHAAPSNVTRSPPQPLISSKATTSAQVPAKFALQGSAAPSPMSRIVSDLPYPPVKTAHKRRPSFPSSERSMLEVAATTAKSLQLPSTSASSSRHAPDAQGSDSRSRHDRQLSSETLSNLPTLTPPSKLERVLPPPPPPPFQAMYELPPPPPPLGSSPSLSTGKAPIGSDSKDGILEAIASHDKSTLKKVKTMQNPTLRKPDDRSHLLEQIRAKSFNLRHTVVEKVEAPLPRPVTNINVAAILEKANAIRQAFAGSDEDDEDTDDWNDV
ncbi:unnamed protein product [Calypogeia fissa]